jgi:type I restriction enzyme S subunit
MDRRQLPEGWGIKKLGEICTVIAGQSPEGQYYNQERIGLPFYQGKKEFGDKFIKAPQTWTQKITKEAEKGDILMSVRAPVGPINFATEKICIGRGLAAIKAGDKIDNYFLFYELLSKQNEIKGNEGAVFPSINKSQIENIQFQFPSLDEQKRIVAILDEAFEGIDQAIRNTEKNLANARELFDSYLNKIFIQKGDDWEERKLGNVCSIKHGFAFKSEFFTNEKSKYVLLTPGSFYESGGYREQGEKTKYYTGDIPEGFILKKGDFLFAMTEQAVGLLGSSLIVPELDRFLHNQRLGLVQVVDNFEWHNDFFFHQCNTQKFRAAVQNSASGVKVRHTSPNKLGAIIIAFPKNIREQKIIADNLNELHTETQHLETIYRQKIAALNELKQSILQKAFTGQLTSKKSGVA